MSAIFRTALVFAVTLTWAAQAKTIDQQFAVEPGQLLALKTDNGSIEITTHSASEVSVYVVIEGDDADDFDVRFSETSDGLRVTGEKSTSGYWNHLRVKYRIDVPKNFNLDLSTAGGRIEIDDLIGDIEARTSGGSISVGDVTGDVELHTSGGSISTDNIDGEIDAHTSGGSIRVTFASQPKQDASLTTSGGSITARLPADVAIDLDATTSGGRVRSDFTVDGRIKKQSIRGQINGGGPELELHTSGGSVRVEKI